MNKTLFKLLLSLCLLSSLSIKAQKVIENPAYDYCSTGILEIKKVELSDKDTRISFKATFSPHWWIKLSSESYLTDKDGESGKKYKFLSAEGMIMDKREANWTPECGFQEYTLVFEPLPEGTETFNYIEKDKWDMFGIDLTGKTVNPTSFLPQELNEEWRTTDEYNEWKYGFYDSIAIVDMDFWEYDYLKKKGKGYEVGLKKGEDKKTLYLKKNKNGTAEIGDLKKGNPLYTTSKTKIFKHKEVEEKPFFRNENAVLRVYMDNFNPKYMDKTINLHMMNHITRESNQMVVALNDNGTAELNIPLNQPILIWGEYGNYNLKFYVEPGDTLLIRYDINEIKKDDTEPAKYFHNNSQPSFMGNQSDINRDLLSLGDYQGYNPYNLHKEIETLSFEKFQSQYMGYYNKSIERLNNSVNEKLISEKSKRIAKAHVTCRVGSRILNYNYDRDNYIPKAEDFKSLENFDLNDLYLLSIHDFWVFVNRYEYTYPRHAPKPKVNYEKFPNDLFSELDNKKIKYDTSYKDSIRAFCDFLTNYNNDRSITDNITEEELDKIKKLNIATDRFVNKYNDIAMPLLDEINKMAGNSFSGEAKRKSDYHIDSLNLKKDLLYTLMYSHMVEKLGSDKAVAKENLETLKQYVSYKEMTDQMDDYFEREYNKIEYEKIVLPDGVAKDYFNSIIAPHKGKIVVVDFWATSCGPCIAGIKHTAELRERLKGKDVAFVFITDKGSSPRDSYEKIMKDVDGYKHYIENDEMNHLKALFKINGIPRYLLVDRDGDVVDQYFYVGEGEMNEVLEKYGIE